MFASAVQIGKIDALLKRFSNELVLQMLC